MHSADGSGSYRQQIDGRRSRASIGWGDVEVIGPRPYGGNQRPWRQRLTNGQSVQGASAGSEMALCNGVGENTGEWMGRMGCYQRNEMLGEIIGAELRRRRQDQGRTLREVSSDAKVSLGYLSEVERGQKEASSELLHAICSALSTPLSEILGAASSTASLQELQAARLVGRSQSAHILAA
jgi:hypothetical protein